MNKVLRCARAWLRYIGQVAWIVVRPIHDFIEHLFQGIGGLAVWAGGLLLVVGVPLSALYLLIRFVRWAWTQ